MWKPHKQGKIKLPEHHGKCAEVANISEYLWKIDPNGRFTMKKAQEALEGMVSHAIEISTRKPQVHGEYKEACKSCIEILNDFNIKEYKTN